MKTRSIFYAGLALMTSCASEIDIASSDVPEAVMSSFSSKYPQAYFRPDGTFSKEE